MIHRPMQRNVFTLVSSTNVLNKTVMNNSFERMSVTTVPQSSSSTSNNVYDDSLTNLSWLHDINILKRTIPAINNSTSSSNQQQQQQQTNCQEKDSSNVFSSSLSSSLPTTAAYANDFEDANDLNIQNDEQWRIYRTNPHLKPVYSYSQMILLALKQSGHEKMTLQMIYEWVAENFPYFKKMEPTWQNSIRHNLSLSKWFVKVARTKKETGGKGGFWKLSPDYNRQHSQTIAPSSQTSLNINSTSNKRPRTSKRSGEQNNKSLHTMIKSEAWIDPTVPSMPSTMPSSILQCQTSTVEHRQTYVRMPSSFLSPVSSPDSLPVPPPFNHQQQQLINEFSSVLTPSPSTSPSSMSSAMNKQNFLSTKFDDTDMLLLDAANFDWDAYLSETGNDIDVQPLLATKSDQDLFNEFNAALIDLTSSAEAAAGGDSSAFDGFDYPIKPSTFHTLFEDDDQQSTLTIKGRGIKRPSWWLSNETSTPTRLPSLETAFDIKLPK